MSCAEIIEAKAKAVVRDAVRNQYCRKAKAREMKYPATVFWATAIITMKITEMMHNAT